MLNTMPGLDVVATATNAREGIEACVLHRPDLLVLDLALPDKDGVAVGRKLIAAQPDAQIIILSGQCSTFVCPADLRKGVFAVVRKTEAFSNLEKVVKRWLSEWNKAHRPEAATPASEAPEPSAKLTPRELQIFTLMGRGLLSKEIANELSISIETVADHRKHIARKLGTVGSELVQQAFQTYQESMAGNPRPPAKPKGR